MYYTHCVNLTCIQQKAHVFALKTQTVVVDSVQKLTSENEQSSVSSAAEKTSQAPQGEAGGIQSGGEKRGDLIQFYNSVFVLKVKGFAMRYGASENHRVTTTPCVCVDDVCVCVFCF